MTAYLLDTNIISALLKKQDAAESRLRETVATKELVFLSAVVHYEAKRGLLKRDAKNQMQALERLVARFEWCDVVQADWELAARLWVERAKIGRPIEDADLLIAAQARRLGATLVTDNTDDFDDLGVTVENWRKQ
ncbi:MAG: type II toxin-antitoxin system VapC family toxin [Chloroflexi bacterium]|nr:type II toxin-antitoxin system VapC family toxin [Chloroflexota bacterium]